MFKAAIFSGVPKEIGYLIQGKCLLVIAAMGEREHMPVTFF